MLSRSGFAAIRQKGSHIRLRDSEGNYVTVPKHSQIKEPTLKSILDQAGISPDEFLGRRQPDPA